MKAQGQVTAAVLDIGVKDTIVQLRIAGDVREDFAKLKDDEVDIDIRKHREKRSLNANGLYWAIVGQIGRALQSSNNAVHNHLLRRYGVAEQMDGQMVYVVVPDDTDDQILETESYHLKPTSQVKEGKDGKLYRTYILMRGSSSYDTKEMMRLIDGALSEAKEMGLGIDTSDIERWKALEAANEK